MVNETEVTIERASQLTGFTRHHLDRLVKAGVLHAKDKDGISVLDVSSLEAYSEKRAQKKAQKKDVVNDQEESIITDGAKYVSLNRAARLSGYTQEYVQGLGRDEVIQTKYLGERLYIHIESLFAHRRAIHAQQAKWYEEQARENKQKEDPVVVHRVSIYGKDETPLFPVLSSKHQQQHAPVAEERMQHGSRLKTAVVERPRKSTPSPFAMRAPERPASITVHEPVKTRAIAEDVRPIPQRKSRAPERSILKLTSIAITASATALSLYIAFMMLTAQPHTARAAFIIGDVLGITETTIPYYRK